MPKFVVTLTYVEDRDRVAEVRPEHREYSKELTERGALLASGPFIDGDGALLVYEAADETALREILTADPYAMADVLAETRIREWNAVGGSWVV